MGNAVGKARSSGPSKTRVDRAGVELRKWWWGDDPASPEVGQAIDLADEYRATFSNPLKKVTVGVRQFVERETDEVIVGQRLKRLPAIVLKLDRFGSMRLSQMEDIGGCRAILPGGRGEVLGVLRRIKRNWKVARVDDYDENPKVTGYRAVHVVVRRDDRLVEIQLRTPGQHNWAEAVSRMAARTGHPLKDGRGPADILNYFELVGWAIGEQDHDRSLPEGFLDVVKNHQDRLPEYFNPPR